MALQPSSSINRKRCASCHRDRHPHGADRGEVAGQPSVVFVRREDHRHRLGMPVSASSTTMERRAIISCARSERPYTAPRTAVASSRSRPDPYFRAATGDHRMHLRGETLSTDPSMSDLQEHILKIGSTTGRAIDRLAGAAHNPTFLRAPAELIDEFETRGVHPRKIEALLHRFFAAACIDVRIPNQFGGSVDPREWFFVSATAVEQAVRLIATSSLHLYASRPLGRRRRNCCGQLKCRSLLRHLPAPLPIRDRD